MRSSFTATAGRHRVKRFPCYGWLGLMALVGDEALMLVGVQPFHDWITPLQWTAYLLVLDASLVRLRGDGLVLDHGREFVAMALASYASWVMFEGYNLHLQNWRYINAPVHPVALFAGSVWAFAAVFPAVLLTSEVIDELGWCRWATFRTGSEGRDAGLGRGVRVPPWVHGALVMMGFLFCTVPLLVPGSVARYLFVAVWIGFAFLLEPFNYRLERPSLLRALERRSAEKLVSLFVAGLACGLLWEFWNYWAGMKWVYELPYFNRPRIFEMPLYGYLGFLAFGVECFVIWHFVRGFLPSGWRTAPATATPSGSEERGRPRRSAAQSGARS